ncbi:MAG: prevent-host-death family protein [Ramlibacter sp.]|jgi:antitoxin YefM|nr:prevent-host-death family protein [Ramlibacter sp.]
MDAITYTHAQKNLAATMDRTIANREPVIITRHKGQAVVMMSLEDFQSWEETAYLLNSPANARKLMKSLDEAVRGKTRTKTHRTPTTLDGSGRRGAPLP